MFSSSSIFTRCSSDSMRLISILSLEFTLDRDKILRKKLFILITFNQVCQIVHLNQGHHQFLFGVHWTILLRVCRHGVWLCIGQWDWLDYRVSTTLTSHSLIYPLSRVEWHTLKRSHLLRLGKHRPQIERTRRSMSSSDCFEIVYHTLTNFHEFIVTLLIVSTLAKFMIWFIYTFNEQINPSIPFDFFSFIVHVVHQWCCSI